jgi:hypothetical protein
MNMGCGLVTDVRLPLARNIAEWEGAMSGMLEEQLDLLFTTQQQRHRRHKAEQAECVRAVREGRACLERMQATFCMEVRPLIEQAVARANRHLAKRSEKCRLAEISGYFTGPLYPGGSACNPLAYELRIDGQEVGETLLVELTHQGMIEAALGPFRPTISEGTARRNFDWAPVPLDRFDASIASDLVLRYITALTARWPVQTRPEQGGRERESRGADRPKQVSACDRTLTPMIPDERPPVDLIAEGMWGIAAGKFRHESWMMLPAQRRAWWRTCAIECVRRWMAEVAGSYY